MMPPPCALRSFRCNTKFVMWMWNWAVGNDPSSLVSLIVNISHNPLCSMERIGSYLFRKVFTLIRPIITFLGLQYRKFLTHSGRVTHICVSKLTIIGSDNGLSPDRRQAIIWTNDGLLLIGPLGTNFSEILIEILTLSFKKMRLKMSSAKWRHLVSASVC